MCAEVAGAGPVGGRASHVARDGRRYQVLLEIVGIVIVKMKDMMEMDVQRL